MKSSLQTPDRSPVSNWLKLAILVLFWGSSFVATKIAIVSVPAIWLVFFRTAIGATVLIVMSKILRARLPNSAREWAWCAVIGFIGTTLPFFLISWATGLVSSASAGMMMALVPFFTLILGAVFLPHESITTERIAGLVMGFCGVALIIWGRQSTADAATISASIWPYLALIAATLCYSSNVIIALRSVRMPPLTKSSGSLIMAALAALFWALIITPPGALPALWTGIGWQPALAILYLAIFPTALMTILTFSLLDTSSAAFFSLINYLVPGAAIIFGALLLHERLTPTQYLGFVLVLSGIAITQAFWRRLRRKRTQS